MKPTESPQKAALWSRVRNSRGFSLIEMAIVLVIIGIIVAAIIKGQDLLFNSRAKQLVSTANSWKIATLAYMDRNGRFPGDVGTNGTIGDTSSEQTSGGTAIDEIASTLSNAPANPVLIGGQSYWFYLGYTPVTVGSRNVIVICPSVDCSVPLNPDGVEMFKALDTSIDGSADAGVGQMRGVKTTGAGFHTIATAATGGRANGYIEMAAGGADLENATTTGATAGANPWVVSTQYGAAWAFDKQF